MRAGQSDQAEQTYRRLSALPNKGYKPLHALFLFQTGKRDQAVAELERLARGRPWGPRCAHTARSGIPRCEPSRRCREGPDGRFEEEPARYRRALAAEPDLSRD